MTLDTTRLVLRRFSQGDLDDVCVFASDSVLGPMSGWKPLLERPKIQEIVENFAGSEKFWAIEERVSCRVIGLITLQKDPMRQVEASRMLGFLLAAPYWGKGLAQEAAEAILHYAFETQGASIVSAVHYPSNAQSKRVIEKLGFRHEGTLRQAITRYDGAVVDYVCYSLTRAEWAERQSPT